MTRELIVWSIVFFMMAFVMVALGSGLFFLIRGKSDSRQMVKSLTFRIVVSITLFVLLFVAYFMGWIHPHGIYPN